MTTFNYTSTAADPTLDEAFERALATAREGRAAPLPHLVAGEEHAAGEIFERTDPCDPARVISRAHTADDETVAAAVRAARSRSPGGRRRRWRSAPPRCAASPR